MIFLKRMPPYMVILVNCELAKRRGMTNDRKRRSK